MKDLDKLLDFVRFTHEIRNIKRAILLESNNIHENDSEHMYQLALVAWFLIENDDLNKLDKYRCVGMALVQDVTEVYSGDTNAHASAAERAAHEKRSKEAVKQIKQQWPTFTSLHELLKEYEERKTPESQFIYALDKLIPIINIYLYEGRSWKQQGIDYEEVVRNKTGKISISPDIDKYYQQLLNLLQQSPQIFGKPKK